MSVPHELVRILLAEDNLDDITITKKALEEAGLVNQLFVVRDGEEALDFLHHRKQYQDPSSSPRPGLILLDLNMPKVNGLEVLARIKADPDLKIIPVIILTSSRREEDVVSGYGKGCNSFLQKPVEFEEFVKLVREIGLYWGVLNIPPPQHA